MPVPRRIKLSTPPIGQRRCPKCGLLLHLAYVLPSNVDGEDQRTFECPMCSYAETETVEFR